MTTMTRRDCFAPLTPEERAKRDEKDSLARAVWEEKLRPENIVVLSLSAVPPSYRHFLPREGD